MQKLEKGDAITILKNSFPGNFSSIKIIPITEAGVKKSSVCNKVTSKILKVCVSFISHPLSYIYNHPLYTGIFPGCLKIAVVKPFYKKGDTSGMTNYRPISTVFSKVVLKAVHSRSNQHLHTNNILVTAVRF
jgi:hypothetical protein